MIRVHIDFASAVTQAGLEALLREQSEIEIVPSPSDADVVVRGDLGDVCAASIVILSDEIAARDALRAGARAALPSAATREQIVGAIFAAAAGLAVIPAEELTLLLPPAQPVEPHEPLTPREMDVLEMLAEGLSNKLIAHRLNISTHTAKFHVNAILAKLGAGTRTEAVMRGIRLGLIQV